MVNAVRICPNCGFQEHPMWRPRASRVFCEYVKVDTLAYNNPELWAEIEAADPNPYDDGHWLYHITKPRQNVERIEKALFEYTGWGRDGEPEKAIRAEHVEPPTPLSAFIEKDELEKL